MDRKQANMEFNNLFSNDKAIFETRALHLDLKGTPPTFTRLLELLEIIKEARYNALLVEWEDMFPWSVDRNFRSHLAYNEQQVNTFHKRADILGLEVIPLVQCIGHMETPLSLPRYKHLREVPQRTSDLNPLAPGARKLVESMYNDVLAHTPNVSRFHIGGDEAWSFGQHPDTATYIAKYGPGALFMHHVGPLLDMLISKGIRPLIWHDMLISSNWNDKAIQHLVSKADFVVWGYGEHPDDTSEHFSRKYIRRFNNLGATMWAGTAYKAGDGAPSETAELPDAPARARNAQAWTEVACAEQFVGAIATGWSRNGVIMPQHEPIDGALDSLLNVGVILHDGKQPDGGLSQCSKALENLPEASCFTQCKSSLKRLEIAREQVWLNIYRVSHIVAQARLDSRRTAIAAFFMPQINKSWHELINASEEIFSAFENLMPPEVIKDYLKVRIDAVHQQLQTLYEKVQHIDPDGYEYFVENTNEPILDYENT